MSESDAELAARLAAEWEADEARKRAEREAADRAFALSLRTEEEAAAGTPAAAGTTTTTTTTAGTDSGGDDATTAAPTGTTGTTSTTTTTTPPTAAVTGGSDAVTGGGAGTGGAVGGGEGSAPAAAEVDPDAETTDTADCPVCGKTFPDAEIVAHVDACLLGGSAGMDPPSASTATTATTTAGSGASSTTAAGAAPVAGDGSTCPICSKRFPVEELERHAMRCAAALSGSAEIPVEPPAPRPGEPAIADISKGECPLCFESFPEEGALAKHAGQCVASGDGRRRHEKFEGCPNCRMKMPPDMLPRHIMMCSSVNSQWRQLDEDEKLAIGMTRKGLDLTPSQHKALDWVHDKAKALSDKAYQPLLKRFEGMGYAETNLKRTLLWIRNEAPIIIHFDAASILDKLTEDTHYRNQFETNTSRGTLSHDTRTKWEDRLFGRCYHGAKGFERCKYGVLNIVADPTGVQACAQYGTSIMVLTHETRLRTTFASKDSGYEDAVLATTEHYCHTLNDYSDDEIRSVVEVANGARRCARSDKISNYKEVQIHGEVQMSRDIELVFINPSHKKDAKIEKLMDDFSKKNGCPVLWMDTSGRD